MKIYYMLLLLILILSMVVIAKKYRFKYERKKNKNKEDLIKMYTESNSTVVVHIGAGLGNRLMSIAGIIIMSIYYESKPKSINNNLYLLVLNWNEFDLFYYIQNYSITTDNKYYGKLNIICPSDLQKINTINKQLDIHFDYLWCDLFYDLFDSKLFITNLNKYINDMNMMNKLYSTFWIYYYIFNRIIKVKENIKREVNNFVSKFNNNPFVGVQIRVGNEDLREQVFSDRDDIEVMINLLDEKYSNKLWFVTGDSRKTKLRLCDTHKNVFVYTKDRAKHYERCKTDATTIVEHEILSKSSFMVISKSTYGLTALLKSGIFLVNKNNLSYEITRKKAYDVKTNFRRITITWGDY